MRRSVALIVMLMTVLVATAASVQEALMNGTMSARHQISARSVLSGLDAPD